jgi:hypothetical protein
VVTYDPTEAQTGGTNDGVEIPEGADSDPITITNNYAGVSVEAASAVVVTPSFTG